MKEQPGLDAVIKSLMEQAEIEGSQTNKMIDYFSNLLVEKVTNNIVGEPISYFDSTSRFYPSISFFFKEHQNGKLSKHPRRSQIKLRLPCLGTEINESLINKLRSNCSKLANLSYVHGAKRLYFVSKDKRCKTVIFTDDTDQAQHVLKQLMDCINIKFDVADVSITTGRHRKNDLKRSEKLMAVPLNDTDYNEVFEVKFFRSILLVNGLKQPVRIV